MTLPGEGEKEFDQMQFRQELAAMDVEQLTVLLSKTDRRSDFLKFTLVREELDRRQAETQDLSGGDSGEADAKPIHVMEKPLEPKVTQAHFEASRLVQQSRLKVRHTTGRYVTGEHLRQKVEAAVEAPAQKKATVKIKNYRSQLGFKEEAESLEPEKKGGAFTALLGLALVMMVAAFTVCVITVFDLPGKEPLLSAINAAGKTLGIASSSGA